jgi:hypothetical protein
VVFGCGRLVYCPVITGVSVYLVVSFAVSCEAAAKFGPGFPLVVTMPSDSRFRMCWWPGGW